MEIAPAEDTAHRAATSRAVREFTRKPVRLFYTSPRAGDEQRRGCDGRQVGEQVAVARVERRRPEKAGLADEHRGLKNVALLDDAAVGIDDAADSRVGGAHQVSSLFDGAHRGLFE